MKNLIVISAWLPVLFVGCYRCGEIKTSAGNGYSGIIVQLLHEVARLGFEYINYSQEVFASRIRMLEENQWDMKTIHHQNLRLNRKLEKVSSATDLLYYLRAMAAGEQYIEGNHPKEIRTFENNLAELSLILTELWGFRFEQPPVNSEKRDAFKRTFSSKIEQCKKNRLVLLRDATVVVLRSRATRSS